MNMAEALTRENVKSTGDAVAEFGRTDSNFQSFSANKELSNVITCTEKSLMKGSQLTQKTPLLHYLRILSQPLQLLAATALISQHPSVSRREDCNSWEARMNLSILKQ